MNDNPVTEPAHDWNTREGRVKLVRAVFQYLKDNPTEREACLDYKGGRDIVVKVAATINMQVPPDTRVLFLPEGDWEKGEPPPQGRSALVTPALVHNAGSSLIIDLPPEKLSVEESLPYACTYLPW